MTSIRTDLDKKESHNPPVKTFIHYLADLKDLISDPTFIQEVTKRILALQAPLADLSVELDKQPLSEEQLNAVLNKVISRGISARNHSINDLNFNIVAQFALSFYINEKKPGFIRDFFTCIGKEYTFYREAKSFLGTAITDARLKEILIATITPLSKEIQSFPQPALYLQTALYLQNIIDSLKANTISLEDAFCFIEDHCTILWNSLIKEKFNSRLLIESGFVEADTAQNSGVADQKLASSKSDALDSLTHSTSWINKNSTTLDIDSDNLKKALALSLSKQPAQPTTKDQKDQKEGKHEVTSPAQDDAIAIKKFHLALAEPGKFDFVLDPVREECITTHFSPSQQAKLKSLMSNKEGSAFSLLNTLWRRRFISAFTHLQRTPKMMQEWLNQYEALNTDFMIPAMQEYALLMACKDDTEIGKLTKFFNQTLQFEKYFDVGMGMKKQIKDEFMYSFQGDDRVTINNLLRLQNKYKKLYIFLSVPGIQDYDIKKMLKILFETLSPDAMALIKMYSGISEIDDIHAGGPLPKAISELLETPDLAKNAEKYSLLLDMCEKEQLITSKVVREFKPGPGKTASREPHNNTPSSAGSSSLVACLSSSSSSTSTLSSRLFSTPSQSSSSSQSGSGGSHLASQDQELLDLHKNKALLLK